MKTFDCQMLMAEGQPKVVFDVTDAATAPRASAPPHVARRVDFCPVSSWTSLRPPGTPQIELLNGAPRHAGASSASPPALAARFGE